MHFLPSFATLFCLISLTSAVLGYVLPRAQVEVINDGSTMKNGKLSGNKYGLSWIASGVLKHNGCPSQVKIQDCYSMELTNDPKKMLDTNHLDQPRQRIELPAPHAGNGESFTYTWKFYLDSKTGTNRNFFHLWQLLQRPKNANGGPALTMDAVNGKIVIKDDLCPNKKCPSVPLEKFTDRTVLNTMIVTFGPKGKIDYKLTDASSGETLLKYSRSGEVGRDEVNLQFGTYRKALAGMTISQAYAGDFTSKKH